MVRTDTTTKAVRRHGWRLALGTSITALLVAPLTLALADGSAGAAAPTWVQQAVPAGTGSVSSVSCVNASDCWAVSTAAPGGGVLVTSDGGASGWSAQSVPVQNGDTSGNLTGISCADTSHCVAVGYAKTSTTETAIIDATTNGGSTWVAQTTPTGFQSLGSVTCVNASDCWATGVATTGVPSIIATTDGGGTWSTQIGLEGTDAMFGNGSTQAIACANTQDCWAVGSTVVSSAVEPAIIATSNGGTTWGPQLVPFNSGSLLAVSCANASVCTAVGTNGNSSNSVVVSTVNGGTAWTLDQHPPAVAVLDAVNCSTGPCLAGGGTQAAAQSGPSAAGSLFLNATSTAWTSSGTFPDASTPGGVPSGISCVSTNDCWVGAADLDKSSTGAIFASTDVSTGGGSVPPVTNPQQSNATSGYWLVASDGGIFTFGNAGYYGSMGGIKLNAPVVGMAPTANDGGYWEVATDGGIFSFGNATFFGSMGGMQLNKPIVGIATTPDGGGYWEVASDGGIFSFGDAAFLGSLGNLVLNSPIVGIAATPDGDGYWLVAADGGVFAFGDAPFYGSLGGRVLPKPVVGIAATPDGMGYWLMTANGQITGYNDADAHGTVTTYLAAPLVGVASSPDGGGYWEVASDGGVFSFGDAPFWGSLGNVALNAPIVSLAATA